MEERSGAHHVLRGAGDFDQPGARLFQHGAGLDDDDGGAALDRHRRQAAAGMETDGLFDWVDAATPAYLNNRKVSIYAGSNEIQRNVIAKAILGL